MLPSDRQVLISHPNGETEAKDSNYFLKRDSVKKISKLGTILSLRVSKKTFNRP